MHNLKLTIFKCSVKYIHIFAQLISRTLFIYKTEPLYNSPFLFLPTPGTCMLLFISIFDYSGYLIQCSFSLIAASHPKIMYKLLHYFPFFLNYKTTFNNLG